MTGYSKGSRGLFVYSREASIFTGATVSPGLSRRQRPSRYAIRAGRNLPDKEFRYLRTVIVTAAVYRGFGPELRLATNPSSLTFRHRAGVRPYTSSYELAESCVFSKQSLGPLYCDPFRLNTLVGHPFSLSYGAILPSSFARVLPSALGFSPRPPVSVYGTVASVTRLEDFLGSVGSARLWPEGLPITFQG